MIAQLIYAALIFIIFAVCAIGLLYTAGKGK